jgi:hypothetical protein
MKIHIWQQFASNHSNSFTVVRTFPAVEAAQTTAATLQQLFDDIQAQWKDKMAGRSNGL